MPSVKFITDVTVAPKPMLFLLSSMVTEDDEDAKEMARASKFDDPFFGELSLGIEAQDLDVLAEAISGYLPNVGYSACRQKMLEMIAEATYRRIVWIYDQRPFSGMYTDAAHNVVEKIIGDARLDRWISYSIIKEELDLLRESTGAFGRADERRVRSWLAAAKQTGETGMTTKPSVTFELADRRRAESAGGEAIALAWDAYSISQAERKSATQNALVELANRMRREFDPDDPDDRQAMHDATAEEVARAVERAILSFPPRRRAE